MKNLITIVIIAFMLSTIMFCKNDAPSTVQSSAPEAGMTSNGQDSVVDNESQKDIVKIAVGSKDHTTLVAALQQADYVDDLSNAGPFTVFAPTNEAFAKLPAGTVESLMKNDKKADLQNILEYHVSIGVFKEDMLRNGQKLGQVNSQNITITKTPDGKIKINGTANVLAAVPASNGLVYVIDEVLLPPANN
ncbi:MAG: fasciclin domain-containing protein [Saprospiraceae bacterium]|jgi:uncharacterized surface protein with fasciclin (FAS1) repeats|nr:fasciclin domain-containing protein [Saprospiraceae bacterium]MBP8940830.1 fasciclin domain-containing protein [Saprospiraceae bacterium]